MKNIFAPIFFVCLLFVHSAHAMERFGVLTTDEMYQMLEERKAGKKDFILVNTLDELIYKNSSIPGSINIPWSKVTQLSDRLGKNKHRLIVTYCMGYR